MTRTARQLEHQALELLVQNMRRLDESVAEESQGVYNTLGTGPRAHVSQT